MRSKGLEGKIVKWWVRNNESAEEMDAEMISGNIIKKNKNGASTKMETGFILINKPPGMTSHDVVDYLRKVTGIRKIGHAGTLDPVAEGLLILGIGKKSTKNLSQFLKMDKEYVGKIKLGEVSNTYDKEGKIEKTPVKKIPSKKEVERVLGKFKGEILQAPPPFSAKKVKGKKLYQLAKRGISLKAPPKKVKIQEIEILEYRFPYLKIRVKCSSGTYIRSLAHDIGKTLECGGYLVELKRTKVGDFSLKKAHSLSEITKENWQKFLL